MKATILILGLVVAGTLLGRPLPALGQESTEPQSAASEKRLPELFVFDFFSPVSGDCADIKPVVQKAERRFAERVKIIHVDVNHPKNKAFIEHAGIQAVPTLLVVNAAGDQLKTLAGREQSNILLILLETLLPDRRSDQQALMPERHETTMPVALTRQEARSDPGT